MELKVKKSPSCFLVPLDRVYHSSHLLVYATSKMCGMFLYIFFFFFAKCIILCAQHLTPPGGLSTLAYRDQPHF